MTIADSEALRSRRSRAHRRGDHSLCKRCAVIRGELDGPEGQEIPSGERAKLKWLAEGLATAYKADPGNALLARELRLTLQTLMSGGEGHDSDLNELFAEFSSA